MIIGKGLSTTIICIYILQQGGHGEPSLLDDLGVRPALRKQIKHFAQCRKIGSLSSF
jgi:hypothetical protein